MTHIIHPPGTSLAPNHPFVNVCILFVPRHRPASGPMRTVGQGNDVERRKADEEAFWSFKRRLLDDVATSIKYPLVPLREPDLEDIAFEILRERYRGR